MYLKSTGSTFDINKQSSLGLTDCWENRWAVSLSVIDLLEMTEISVGRQVNECFKFQSKESVKIIA